MNNDEHKSDTTQIFFEKQQIIPEQNSKRITALRFLLIFFVVFEHIVPGNASKPENNSWYFIRSAFLNICGTAVPLFFLFSSYLQFKKEYEYKQLIKKRVKSLFLPYIIWTLFCIVFYYVIQSFSEFSSFFSDIDIIRNWQIKDYISAFWYHKKEGLKQPLLGQYWFIRELMILIIISPFIQLWFNKSKGTLFSFVILALFFKLPLFILVDARSLFFYVLGLYFAKTNKKNFFEIADMLSIYEYLIVFMFIQLLKYFHSGKLQFFPLDLLINCCFILKISNFFINKEKIYDVLKYLAGFSFFLYSVHWPFIINPLKAILPKLIPCDSVQFVIIGFLCVLLGTSTGIILKKICPPLFAVLNGGRK